MPQKKSEKIMNRLEKLYPKLIDLKTDRIIRLLNLLGNPHHNLPPIIHIAGTNGKGSTAAFFRAGLTDKDKLVHSYTSPHLINFNERIRVANTLISEPLLSSLLLECEKVNNGKSITLFEIITCLAFLAFSRTKANWTILEVGLGGRFDATNVINKPSLSVITPISIDHQEFLGKTLEKIAFEKAGILRPNVVAIIGKQEKQALDVIKSKAKEIKTPLLVYNEDYTIVESLKAIIFEDEWGKVELSKPYLNGSHQINNASMALAGLRQLKFQKSNLNYAMTNARWAGRLQKLDFGKFYEIVKINQSEIWVDGGHNQSAGSALSETFNNKENLPLYLIFGMLNTKDPGTFLKYFVNKATKVYFVEIPEIDFSIKHDHLVKTARTLGITYSYSNNIESSVIAIQKESKYQKIRILICGSLYLAGYALKESGFTID